MLQELDKENPTTILKDMIELAELENKLYCSYKIKDCRMNWYNCYTREWRYFLIFSIDVRHFIKFICINDEEEKSRLYLNDCRADSKWKKKKISKSVGINLSWTVLCERKKIFKIGSVIIKKARGWKCFTLRIYALVVK